MYLVGSSAPREHSIGIDFFRGLLVAGVMLGHFAELSDRHSFATWFGTGLRMPVFMGLAGYLFNLESARASGLSRTIRKYHGRVVLPWLIACALYLASTRQLDVVSLLQIFYHPPFHLWFVPTMMAFSS